jgi:hypothetical protein
MDNEIRGLHATEAKRALQLGDIFQIREEYVKAQFFYDLADRHTAACGAPPVTRDKDSAVFRQCWNHELSQTVVSY